MAICTECGVYVYKGYMFQHWILCHDNEVD